MSLCQATDILVYIKYQKNGHYHSVMTPHGSKLLDIEGIFMKIFADVIPEGSRFSDFKFKLVHGKTMVDIKNDYELQPNDLLVANYKFRSIGPFVPHPTHSDGLYYMWSIFSQVNDGLLKRQDDGSNVIKSNGQKSDSSTFMQFTAKNVTSGDSDVAFAFTLPSTNPNKVYVMKGVGENQDLIAEEVDKSFIAPSMGDEYKFGSEQFFSYTLYRCIGVGNPKRTDLYLSVHHDGTVQLQKSGALGYPSPSVLFIAVNMTADTA